ncbi:GNAT family N-acetyltransferase [Paenibacillus apiarius]|uniref:GNAT family N-acetyltransferase n=1 Tax=Paenibacillus apiarius TaxID=46240 RepID=A0ABT4DUP2_9BACL|nr:GNAT family N-acetyltransferase [Paenibacillus apiarius]MCY9514408.1 GNAT family N-acetyltransferase [Paenibacillus apiarius]MCY9521054.1 GNAT family N-acetyltransferase [Paenibacillus apiarius]MCY9551900.1 GNAT family N-acetyltransferase [Paenibacillus apiarius]MCY9557788.1 GNAT family N-acetyltransferase [Paenibacillus apiarius]MCY9684475.1 GNAT family N-acetyltransferase [Paenibacillus apiarius]
MHPNIHIVHEAPTPEEYTSLRVAAGLSPKSLAGAEIALKNSIFAVTLRHEDELVGMGRIIGDGGCFYQVVDIAVAPSYQGQGLGKMIMAEITNYLEHNAPDKSYVSLLADVPADHLYKKFGFDYTHPKSLGMFKRY